MNQFWVKGHSHISQKELTQDNPSKEVAMFIWNAVEIIGNDDRKLSDSP